MGSSPSIVPPERSGSPLSIGLWLVRFPRRRSTQLWSRDLFRENLCVRVTRFRPDSMGNSLIGLCLGLIWCQLHVYSRASSR